MKQFFLPMCLAIMFTVLTGTSFAQQKTGADGVYTDDNYSLTIKDHIDGATSLIFELSELEGGLVAQGKANAALMGAGNKTRQRFFIKTESGCSYYLTIVNGNDRHIEFFSTKCDGLKIDMKEPLKLVDPNS